MSLSSKEITELKKLVRLAQELIAKADEPAKGTQSAKTSARRVRPARVRRTGEALAAFRKTLKAERKAGVPVARIAKKHKVSPAYIYQLG